MSAPEPVGLSEEERTIIENAWIVSPKDGPQGDDDPMYLAVERILAAHLAVVPRDDGLAARVEALAEEIEAGGSIWVTTTRLRALLAADGATGQEGT